MFGVYSRVQCVSALHEPSSDCGEGAADESSAGAAGLAGGHRHRRLHLGCIQVSGCVLVDCINHNPVYLNVVDGYLFVFFNNLLFLECVNLKHFHPIRILKINIFAVSNN